MYKTRKDIKNWLKEMKIKNHVINEDLTVDVKGNVDISSQYLKEIPIRFGIVNGSFYCNDNKLKNLNGCPKEINGDFNCKSNKFCPEIIKGDFYCSDNNLTSFEYFPKEIKGKLIYTYNNNIKEELINFNCDMKNTEEIYSDFNDDGNIKEIFNKVNYYKSKKENELLQEVINTNNIKINKKL